MLLIRKKQSLSPYAVRHDVIAGRGDGSSGGRMALGGGGGGLVTERLCHPHSLVLVSVKFSFCLLSLGSFVAN